MLRKNIKGKLINDDIKVFRIFQPVLMLVKSSGTLKTSISLFLYLIWPSWFEILELKT
jgi:hypothetical protein